MDLTAEGSTTTGEVTEATTRINDAPDTAFTRFNFLSLLSLFIYALGAVLDSAWGGGKIENLPSCILYLVICL